VFRQGRNDHGGDFRFAELRISAIVDGRFSVIVDGVSA